MPILGELEAQIMEVLWAQEEAVSVRAVHDELLKSRALAYTTVMTVLDRLAKKGTVHRERDGRAWLYTAGPSRAELVGQAMLRHLAAADGCEEEAFGLFVDGLTGAQRENLHRALDR